MLADETIERVRREARIVAIVGERVKLTQRGRSHLGLCPFHKEKSPSFNVNEERGFYHCFGCGASGDSIKFLRELESLSFIDAVRYIAERQGIEIVETGSDAERREQAESRRRRDSLYGAGETAAAFFEKQLESHSLARHAVAELARRGLDPKSTDGPMAEALRAFRIGYAPYGWDGLAKHLRDSGASLSAAEAVGLLVPRKKGPGHYDRFRHRLMFAIVDLDGKIVGFSGRSLEEPTDEELRAASLESTGPAGEPPAKYLNSPESPVYKKREAVFGLWQARNAVRREDRALLVEGNFDVVSLHARGITNVVAPLGTAFTPEQAKQIRRFSSHVTLFFDGDSAGRRAVRASREPCKEAGLLANVALLPEGRDPDDLVRTAGVEGVQKTVKSARSLLEYLIETTLDQTFAANDAHGLAARIHEVAELIRSDEDPSVRAVGQRHADALAARLSNGNAGTLRAWESVVRQAAEGGSNAPRSVLAAPPDRARSRDRRRDIGLEILGALLDFPALLGSEEILEALAGTEGETALTIAAMRQTPELLGNPEHLLAKLAPSIHPFAAARLAAPRHQSMDDAKAELLGNVEKLNRLELSRHKNEVVEELTRMQASGDFDQEIALLGERARRVRVRRGL